nr:uncharacterized protein LOC109189836 [Ipomoea batatas]
MYPVLCGLQSKRGSMAEDGDCHRRRRGSGPASEVSVPGSSISTCLALGQLGEKGNSHAGWLPICGQVPKFCDHVGGAMIPGFAATDLGGSRVPVAADQPCGGSDTVPEINNVIIAEHVSGVVLEGTGVGSGDCARIDSEMPIGGEVDGCLRHSTMVDAVHDGSFVTPVEGVRPVDGTPLCVAPLKANRPDRPAPDSIRHVGIGPSVPLPPSGFLDDVQLSKWVLECDTVDKNEELFSYNGCIARRDDLCSLAPGELVTVGVIQAWSCILNSREHSKPPNAPSRVFASPFTAIDHAQFTSESPDKQLVGRFSKALEADLALSPYTHWKDVRLLFFPMLHSSHFYLLCVDFVSWRLEIIDNSTKCPNTSLKYGPIPDNLLLLLSRYFLSLTQVAKSKWCLHFVSKRMNMKWRDANNTIDCGVYLMRHMESYAGQSVTDWDCGLVKGDQAALDRFRMKYIREICTTNINSHRTSNVARAIQFLSSLGIPG